MPFTAAMMKDFLLRNQIALADRETRVRAYTMEGLQVCLAGLGQGDEELTFPTCYLVGDALGSPHWIYRAEKGDQGCPAGFKIGSTGKWLLLPWTPKAVVHHNGTKAAPDHPIGLYGTMVTVLPLPPEPEQFDASDTPAEITLESITTPPTPPPEWARTPLR